ncbi:MAG: hypothetical protein AAF999_18630 [Pseudomonadota bacterium]
MASCRPSVKAVRLTGQTFELSLPGVGGYLIAVVPPIFASPNS